MWCCNCVTCDGVIVWLYNCVMCDIVILAIAVIKVMRGSSSCSVDFVKIPSTRFFFAFLYMQIWVSVLSSTVGIDLQTYKWRFGKCDFQKLICSHLLYVTSIFQKVCSSLQKLQDRNFYSSHLFLNRPLFVSHLFLRVRYSAPELFWYRKHLIQIWGESLFRCLKICMSWRY